MKFYLVLADAIIDVHVLALLLEILSEFKLF